MIYLTATIATILIIAWIWLFIEAKNALIVPNDWGLTCPVFESEYNIEEGK